MKKYILTLIIISTGFSSKVLAQGTTLIADLADPSQQNKNLLYEDSEKFIGSRFVIDEYNLGSISLISGDEINNLLIRYNSFDDLIHCKTMESEKENLLKSSLISEFKFYVPSEEKTYVFIQLANKFYEEIHDAGTFSILKRYKKKLVEGVAPNGYNSGGSETLDRLIDVSTYFKRDSKNNELTSFSTRKKDIIDFAIAKGLYPDKKEAKKFLNLNEINLSEDVGIDRFLSLSTK